MRSKSQQFFVNRASCYVLNQQQLQWAVHVVLWVVSKYFNVEAQIILLHEAPDYIGVQRIEHAYSF